METFSYIQDTETDYKYKPIYVHTQQFNQNNTLILGVDFFTCLTWI